MDSLAKKHYKLYVLELEQDKYYVGVTSNSVEYRFNQHKSGFAGAAWTKKYKPIRIISTEDLGIMSYHEAQRHESKIVREYIKKYGLNSTRGGDVTKIVDYVKRFGYFWEKDDWKYRWQAIMIFVFLMIVIIFMSIMYYLK